MSDWMDQVKVSDELNSSVVSSVSVVPSFESSFMLL
jgi:hypothetical protein